MTDIQVHNVNKFVFLTEKNPSKTNTEIIEMFSMAAININAMLWQAIDEGYVKLNGDEAVTLLKPAQREFGKIIDDLSETVVYCIGKLAERKQDIEDHYLNNWLAGYASHDIELVQQLLLERGKIVSYVLRDEPNESDYTFYSLPENAKYQWAKVQFDTEKAGIE